MTAPRTSLISSIGSYVSATSATLTGRRALARWAKANPALAPYRTIAEVVGAAREGSPAVQDQLIAELLAVAVSDQLAQLAVVAVLSRKLTAAVSAWRRGGASADDLAAMEADLVSACWAEVVTRAVGAQAQALSQGEAVPPRLALAIVDRARQSVRTVRRRELRAMARQVAGTDIDMLPAGAERTAAERLSSEVAGAVKAGRITAKAARPVYLTRVLGYSSAEAGVLLGCNADVLRASRSRAERALVA